MQKRLIGSTVALILGVLTLVGGVVRAGEGLLAGPIIILGALAYKSRKKRLLGIVPASRIRVTLEVAALVVICALVLLQNDLANRLYFDPFPNAVIPIWTLVAYALAGIRTRRGASSLSESPAAKL